MSHPSEGKLFAYVDSALSPNERSAIDLHLAQCDHCRNKLDQVARRKSTVSGLLGETDTHDTITSPAVARKRFAAYVQTQKEQTMRKQRASHRLHPAWVAALILIMLSLSLTFTPVRTLASQFLALFRVQKIRFVELNPYALPAGMSLETAAMEIDQLMRDNLVVEEGGDTQRIDRAQANTMMNFTPRYSALMGEDVGITAAPAITMTMNVDAAEVQTLFDNLGYTQYQLPQSMDGAEIQVSVEPSLSLSTPACAEDNAAECVVLVQMPSPTVTAPPELDVEALGELYLQLLGMNEEDAAAFNRNVDWTTTLVVPVPSNQTKYNTVYIDGEAGTLIESRIADKQADYMLVWMKNEIIYAVIGKGDSDTAIRIARSLTE